MMLRRRCPSAANRRNCRSGVIGPSINHGVPHPIENGWINRLPAVIDDSADAAHWARGDWKKWVTRTGDETRQAAARRRDSLRVERRRAINPLQGRQF